ncbi:DoxX family protein [Bacteroides helcogenes]|uniref:DoxX family protein n=1 Tax=Bacteroides helcogenes (strain ATCC 35417 / DSM 20613 / JCM 6297 / CCUG 15421 / P 36-108) TaxID=693979 RepID=E6SU36_BACT6|nr:DoxX family protein [Bacteroides helcogenes]ADV44309.1 DoxX family protein [Bacteroides helcogenes P 36-108]MDY5238281.1 DoxX family protein [Bacteroides helcogenes]
MLKRFLFPLKPDSAAVSAILLIVRIVFGLLLMNHGIDKWSNYQELSAVFPDPLGIGSPLSLGLAIFGELVCSMAFIIGFLYRLAMIPMIFTMVVAFFVIHANDAFNVKELAFVYLTVFILMYIIGPGRFSVDRLIGNIFSRKAGL